MLTSFWGTSSASLIRIKDRERLIPETWWWHSRWPCQEQVGGYFRNTKLYWYWLNNIFSRWKITLDFPPVWRWWKWRNWHFWNGENVRVPLLNSWRLGEWSAQEEQEGTGKVGARGKDQTGKGRTFNDARKGAWDWEYEIQSECHVWEFQTENAEK